MPQIQFSFLGAPQRARGVDVFTTSRQYAVARYAFPDGFVADARLFAMALAQRDRPDAVVLLGTSGSAWHQFLDWTGVAEEHFEEAAAFQAALADRVAASAVTAGDVARAGQLALPVEGIPWRLRLIPLCENQEQFERLLAQMAEEVSPGDGVTLDVTHGLRHLPMLSLLAALYLRKVRQVTVRDIVYGAYEMRRPAGDGQGEETPVLSLGGVLNIATWLEAISRFEASGDYGQFAELIPAEGDVFRRAAFLERTGQASQWRQAFRGLRRRLRDEGSHTLALFRPALQDHLEEVSQPQGYAFLRALAFRSVQRGDYLRASIYALEAFCSRLLPSSRPDIDYDQRWEALDAFLQGRNAADLGLGAKDLTKVRDCAKQLRQLRNKFSHAGDPTVRGIAWGEEGNPLESERAMRAYFKKVLPILLPEQRKL
jgi:CRISPR-associated Csx2 family protein